LLAHSNGITINEIGDAMKSENFHALTSELTQLTPNQRSILSDRLREIEHASSVSRTLIEERLSNQRRALTPTDILRAALGVWEYQQLTRT